ncbi:MAG: hypothetical protein IJ407_01315 [Clostridia bacterium]|nr:hypothetical protein [Clostridia bacterium]
MSYGNCECRANCTGLAVVASLILGIIAAFLQIIGVITVTSVFYWVTFGIAVVYLAVVLATAPRAFYSPACGGFCPSLFTLLIGILGTVLFSVILLAVEFSSACVIGAIFIGALLFFFALIITSSACLVRARCSN